MTSMPLPGARERHPPETVGGQYQTSFISSWMEHGRRGEEKERDKAEESSILPLPRQENQCDAFIFQVTLAIATIVINFAMPLNIEN